ncbi:MAG TPA: DUF438 domain-containing protein [Firmicutes bacterium]|nr:DUF438 domain-containing protein [Bacillota bacterium]
MSELINNREYRQSVLKEIISDLHKGKSVDEVKARFEATFEGVSATEIAELEQALIQEGLPVEEVQRLCDVHAAVFKGSITEIHQPEKIEELPGHPIHTFKLENRELEKFLTEKLEPHLAYFQREDKEETVNLLKNDLERLRGIDRHYSRKENLLFPLLEKYGISAPPKVMWGVDDEIRAAIKEGINLLTDYAGAKDQVVAKIKEMIGKVREMIFKEENILFPMAIDTLTEDEWGEIARESEEIGFFLAQPAAEWKPVKINVEQKARAEGERPADGYIRFETGLLLREEINQIFNALPVDITFVDKEGTVKYFSQAKDRIFPRPKTVIGRKVANCHPPASVHIVEQIVEDFKNGRKDAEEFWIKMGERYVYIRYFAVRDEQGTYMGTLEVTQDIRPLQELTGEKRLVDD